MINLDNGTLRVRKFDAFNFVIEALRDRVKKDGTQIKKWEIRGYYANMELVLKALPVVYLSRKEVSSLEDIYNKLEQIRADTLAVLKELLEQKNENVILTPGTRKQRGEKDAL